MDVLSPELKRALSLTAADLRFADHLIKNVEATEDDGPGEPSSISETTIVLSHIYARAVVSLTAFVRE